jgi:RimJ/RimL family protein N-acetyltransferase
MARSARRAPERCCDGAERASTGRALKRKPTGSRYSLASAMWNGLKARLEGEIVVLEPLEIAHEEGLWVASQHPEIWAWTTPVGESRGFFDSWFAASLTSTEAGTECVLVTVARASGEVIGSTRFHTLRVEHRGLEIGATWLVPSMWRTGANTEAKLLMLGHAFERLRCMRVEFKTDARNERSRAALAALPARFEGIFRKHMLMRGVGVRDSAYYSVIDEDWPEVRANLVRRLAATRAQRV